MLAVAAIVVSLLVQGVTLGPLARLDELAEQDAAPDAVIGRIRAGLQARIGTARGRLDADQQTAREALTRGYPCALPCT